jgi:hypothetical protein
MTLERLSVTFLGITAACIGITASTDAADRGERTNRCEKAFPPASCLAVRAVTQAAAKPPQSANQGTESPETRTARAPAPTILAQADTSGPPPAEDLPTSREELFGIEPEVPATQDKATDKPGNELPVSRDELFGVEPAPKAEATPKKSPVRVRGFVQAEPTYTYASPDHWSRGVVRTQVEALGQLSSTLKWKASLRLDVDPVYAFSDFYNDAVKRNQRSDLLVRETYLDWSAGNWDFRLGRQNIIWGEVVGLFFADVVSARDLRDFILPDFEILRIPQWAARAEYFWKDSHLELAWIPYPSYDNIGQPGAEFYPIPSLNIPGVNTVFAGEERPGTGIDKGNYGLRLSTLRAGWDLAGFYYRSQSASPTFYRDITLGLTPTATFTPKHDRIWQAGGTLTKDFRSFVFKLETIYTSGKGYETTSLTDPDGVVKQNTLEYIASADFTLPRDIRLNLQGFQRYYLDHDPSIVWDDVENGVSLLLSGKINARVEPSLLIIQSLNRDDRLARLKVNWYWRPNLRLAAGWDIFHGPPTGFFGRYDDRDRVYGEIRYTF